MAGLGHDVHVGVEALVHLGELLSLEPFNALAVAAVAGLDSASVGALAPDEAEVA